MGEEVVIDWRELYIGYLSRCKGTPLTFVEFVKLREKILHNIKMEEQKRQWFNYE
jgi:hypothetical protein